MADNKYCSKRFSCGEDLDAALDAALCVKESAQRAEAAAKSAVKTINGVSPDEEGNVEVEVNTTSSGVIAQPEQPTETGVLWLDTDDEESTDTYTKTEIDDMFGSYITDIDALVGGDS